MDTSLEFWFYVFCLACFAWLGILVFEERSNRRAKQDEYAAALAEVRRKLSKHDRANP